MPRKNVLPQKEADMILRAKVAVFEGAEWVSATQVASLGRFSAISLEAWKSDRAIFAIRRNGIDQFPGYAFDPKHDYRPYRAIKKVIELLDAAKDGWGLAFWFQSVNSFLGGKRPMDLLAEKPNEVIAAAADESMGITHG